MQNEFLYGHKTSLDFLRGLLKGFSKRFLMVSLKMDKQMQGGWRMTIFMEEKD